MGFPVWQTARSVAEYAKTSKHAARSPGEMSCRWTLSKFKTVLHQQNGEHTNEQPKHITERERERVPQAKNSTTTTKQNPHRKSISLINKDLKMNEIQWAH